MPPPKPLVLVTDDDTQVRRLIRVILGSAAFRLIEANTGREALREARTHGPDVILLDLALRDMPGVSVIRRLRQWYAEPILVISASAYELEKVEALEAGADDYITKPFGSAELLARVRAALRRAARLPQNPGGSVIVVGDLRIDLAKRLVYAGDSEVHLTPVEYKLFGALMKNAGSVVTQKQLLHETWGPDSKTQADCLRVHVSQLRRKLEKDPASPKYLITEYAVGYRIRAASEPDAIQVVPSACLPADVESS
jgi:two-component system KDP operon response regulator KdpE